MSGVPSTSPWCVAISEPDDTGGVGVDVAADVGAGDDVGACDAVGDETGVAVAPGVDEAPLLGALDAEVFGDGDAGVLTVAEG
jgi:hypothetical protein